MSSVNQPVSSQLEEPKLKLGSYVSGFVLSILLTLSAYLLVAHNGAGHHVLVAAVVALAICQFMVQIYFFLHLGQETKPRWKMGVFFFMIGVVLILVFGSLWIMYSLNVRMTLPQQEQYMNDQDGL